MQTEAKHEVKFIRHDTPRTYAKAAVCGEFIFLAGEEAKDPKTGKIQGSTTAEQTEHTFRNLKTTLESLGSSLDNVIKITAYLKDPRDRNAFGEVRGQYLPHLPPSTLIMGVQLADPEMLVEIEAIATISAKS